MNEQEKQQHNENPVETRNREIPRNAAGRPMWFRAKSYGYGWTPATWQGWIVMLVYLLVVLTGALTINTKAKDALHGVGIFLAIDLAATTTLIIVASMYGEKAGWRWGKKKDITQITTENNNN